MTHAILPQEVNESTCNSQADAVELYQQYRLAGHWRLARKVKHLYGLSPSPEHNVKSPYPVSGNMALAKIKAKADQAALSVNRKGCAAASDSQTKQTDKPDLSEYPAALTPRGGNTGGTYNDDITQRLSLYRYVDEQLSGKSLNKITKLDWFSVSFSCGGDSSAMELLHSEISDLLYECHISIAVRGKGHHGYTDSATLVIMGDTGANQNVGMLAWSSKQGYFLELSGVGCDAIYPKVDDLYQLVVLNNGRISRFDIACDLDGKYCLDKGVTVPTFGRSAAQGAFRFNFTPSHVEQQITQAGDWSGMLFGGLSLDKYDPCQHSPGGLTLYVGSTKSDNQVVIYEKGKQLLGTVPEKEYQNFQRILNADTETEQDKAAMAHYIEKHGVDPSYADRKNWIRVERRFRRGSNKKWLAPEMLLHLDQAFTDSNTGLSALVRDYCEYLEQEYPTLVQFTKKIADKTKSLLLTKKMYWLKHTYGRTIKTLEMQGLCASEIIDSIKRSEGLKDVIFDMV